MRGPKLLFLVVALAASGCDRSPSDDPPTSLAPPIESTPTSRSGEGPSAHARAERPSEPALETLPWEERIALERELAANDPRYAPRMDESGPVLETPGSVVATFGASGATVSFGGREATLAVVALGRDGAPLPLPRTRRPEVVDSEIRSALGDGVVEWWRSLPSGLEHGVTIAERPTGVGELVVEVAVTSALTAQLVSDDAVELRDASGVRVATYAHLVVLDATGVRVPARMTLGSNRVALVIDDEGARYPLVVDPLVTAQEATLLAFDGSPDDNFGWSVALSSDGSRALVGAYYDNTAGVLNTGSARVFLRTGATWTEEATLLAPDRAQDDFLGTSVALSADGSRALVGARKDWGLGSARVFVRTGTTWTPEATLLAPDGAPNDQLGVSVALSSDGSRALVGAYLDDTAAGTDAGSARVFRRTGAVWTQETTLLPPDGQAFDYFGIAVALSADGSRALVGAHADDAAGGINSGTARIFLRAGTIWTEEATLLASDGAPGDRFGCSVALSANGDRAIVGVDYDDTAGGIDAGSARVFLRTGAVWTEDATLLAPDGAAGDGLGYAVALSSDGNRAVVGALGDDTAGGIDAGSARVFLRTGAIWTDEPPLLAPDGAPGDNLGFSVALSSDGGRALAGAINDVTAGGIGAGSARVFTLNGSLGVACGADTACTSGFCTDGVCCSTRCAGGSNDCQACAGALTGGADGTCALLSAAVAPTVVCRAPTDACDAAERCLSTSTSCPTDALAVSGTMCRVPSDLCDAPETCTGSSPACPTDVLAASSVVCRAVADLCDAAERCTGTSAACPMDRVQVGGTTCRPSTALCDRREECDGSAIECPSDELEAAGVVCRPTAGPCDAPEVCSGSAAACPANAFAPAGSACGAAPTSECDVADVCSGDAATCANLFAPPTTLCGTAPTDVCDAADHCEGTSTTCVATYLSGVECRASGGVCDIPEVCSGTSASCPSDTRLSAGVSCRASTDTRCDPEEMCDGFATACPTDVTTCGPMPDAGPRDGGAAVDAPTSGADAGGPPVAAAGCACRATTRGAPLAALLGLLLLVGVLARRTHRRR